jgi:hypothetical protein
MSVGEERPATGSTEPPAWVGTAVRRATWTVIGAVLLTLAALWFAGQARNLIRILIVSQLLGFALEPGVMWLHEKRGWRRGSGTGAILGADVRIHAADRAHDPGARAADGAACEPPRRLLVLTTEPGQPDEHSIEVTWADDGDQTTLVWEEQGLPLDELAAYGAGIQVHVEDLAAHLAGRERCDAVARWERADPCLPRPGGRTRLTGRPASRPVDDLQAVSGAFATPTGQDSPVPPSPQ